MNTQNGNAFLYILIAVILFGALMFTLSRTSDQDNEIDELDTGRVVVAANEILGYAATVTNTMTQMQAAAVQNDQIDFILPSDAAFNTVPNIYKLFHPDGGGLNYKTLPSLSIPATGATNPASGYYVGRFNSVEWTPSTTPDIIFTAYGITQPVCSEINRKLRGSATIPSIPTSLRNFFVDDSLHTGTNANFMVADCAACENIAALCIQDSVGIYAFYSLLEVE